MQRLEYKPIYRRRDFDNFAEGWGHEGFSALMVLLASIGQDGQGWCSRKRAEKLAQIPRSLYYATTGRYLHARPNDSSGNYLPLS